MQYPSRLLLHRQLLLSDRLLQFPDGVVPRPQRCCQWWWILRWWILGLDSRHTEGGYLGRVGRTGGLIPSCWRLVIVLLAFPPIQWLKLLRWEKGQACGL